MADANQRKCGRISQKVQARGCSGSTPVGLTKTAKHLSRRNFCDNFFDIEAVWLAPINEKSDKLAKKGEGEALRFGSFYPKRNSDNKTITGQGYNCRKAAKECKRLAKHIESRERICYDEHNCY